MARVDKFEDLEVWQAGCQLAVGVYQMRNVGEFARDFGLRDQVRRAAVSVPSNIAEGVDRQSNKEFIQFLNYAKGSVAEVRMQLHIAVQLGYLKQDVFENLAGQTVALSNKLGKFISYLRTAKKPTQQSEHESPDEPNPNP